MPELPIQRSEAYPEKIAQEIGPRNSWGWIFRLPEVDHRLPANLLYFFVGRHTGLFLYAPFALLSLLLFLAFSRRSGERWILLGATGAVAFLFLTLIPFNWHGGGGFIGNRYFVNALPAFLFLVTRVAPAWVPVAGYALGGLFVAPILFTPFGSPVPQPTLQAHVRNAPFRFFPFEETLERQIPGYRGQVGNGIYFFGRKDVLSSVGESLWVEGGRPVEIWVSSDVALERPVFQIESPVAPNRIAIELGADRKEIQFDSAVPPANATRVTLSPGAARRRRADDGTKFFSYKLWLQAAAQTFRTEIVAAKPPTEEEAAELAKPGARPRAEFEEATYLGGAQVTYLGEESALAADVYRLEWIDAKAPPAWRAHRLVQAPLVIRNTSASTWPARGATRVSVSYRWLAEDGETVVAEGLRTVLPRDIAPGETAELALEIATPDRPGRYVLEVDALRERLAWFDDRVPGTARRFPIDVAPADGG